MSFKERKPVPCPNCGSTNIGVKDRLTTTADKQLVPRCWAYCRICGQKGPEQICRAGTDDTEEIDIAYKAWNKDKE